MKAWLICDFRVANNFLPQIMAKAKADKRIHVCM